MSSRSKLDDLLDRADALCRQRRVRLTPHRRTVLKLLCASEQPLSAYEILDQLRTTLKNPAPPTVYRALDFLLEQGLAHRLESLHAFIGCTHPEHPHVSQFLICSHCGGVDEMCSETMANCLRTTEQVKGFQTRRPVVELLGTCAQCADRDLSADPQVQS